MHHSIALVLLVTTITISSSEIRQYLIDSLSTCIDPRHNDSQLVKQYVADCLVSQNKQQLNVGCVYGKPCRYQNPNNRNGFYPDLTIPFLQAIAHKTKKGGPVLIFQLYGEKGLRVWPILYAIQNDCPVSIFVHGDNPQEGYNNLFKMHYSFLNNPTVDLRFTMNYLTELRKNVDYCEKFDLLDAYNLMHRLNPLGYFWVFDAIQFLLKKDGIAILSGRMARQNLSRGQDYYGFVKNHLIEYAVKHENGELRRLHHYLYKIESIEDPEHPCGVNGDDCWEPSFELDFMTGQPVPVYYEGLPVYCRKIENVVNYLNPKIINDIVELFNEKTKANLKITAMWYVDNNGIFIPPDQLDYRNPAFLSLIIEKQG